MILSFWHVGRVRAFEECRLSAVCRSSSSLPGCLVIVLYFISRIPSSNLFSTSFHVFQCRVPLLEIFSYCIHYYFFSYIFMISTKYLFWKYFSCALNSSFSFSRSLHFSITKESLVHSRFNLSWRVFITCQERRRKIVGHNTRRRKTTPQTVPKVVVVMALRDTNTVRDAVVHSCKRGLRYEY